jgi:lipoyl-dependent peroxiredoxin
MSKIEKVLLTGKTHTRFSEGAHRVDLKLSSSAGKAIEFTAVQAHPTAEQLFAGAWSACYISAIQRVAEQKKVTLPPDLSVEVEVDLGTAGDAFFLGARFKVQVPGVPREVAEALAHGAHEICPYSKATRGNIDVAVSVV